MVINSDRKYQNKTLLLNDESFIQFFKTLFSFVSTKKYVNPGDINSLEFIIIFEIFSYFDHRIKVIYKMDYSPFRSCDLIKKKGEDISKKFINVWIYDIKFEKNKKYIVHNYDHNYYGPTFISSTSLIWFNYGKIHKVYGPSSIEYKNNSIEYLVYCFNSIPYKILWNKFWEIKFYDIDGIICLKEDDSDSIGGYDEYINYESPFYNELCNIKNNLEKEYKIWRLI